MSDSVLERVTMALEPIEEITALVLGGSRARGTAVAGSDHDVGLYYRANAPLDRERLLAAMRPLVDDPERAELTPVGGWGPWINGGGWLSISGRKVDLLYRDLDRVGAVVAECRAGRISMDYQPGHPHGFCSAIWMGEVAVCQPQFDRRGEVADLKKQVWPYPPALRDALIARFGWEVLFSVETAEKAVVRNEQTQVAGCVYRALACVAQVLFAVNGRYLVNEKGALAEAATFPITIRGLTETTDEIWAAVGRKDHRAALHLLRAMAAEMDSVAGIGSSTEREV